MTRTPMVPMMRVARLVVTMKITLLPTLNTVGEDGWCSAPPDLRSSSVLARVPPHLTSAVNTATVSAPPGADLSALLDKGENLWTIIPIKGGNLSRV